MKTKIAARKVVSVFIFTMVYTINWQLVFKETSRNSICGHL